MEIKSNNGCSQADNAFNAASRIENEAYMVLVPYFRRLAVRAEIVPTGPDFMAMQKVIGDFILRHRNGTTKTVEVKAEAKFTGNLFLEEWSNRARFTQGWMMTCCADVLAYYFIDVRKLCLCPIPALKAWAFHGESGGLFYTYPAKQQAKYDQQNDTWGRIVPIGALKRGVASFVGPFDPQQPEPEVDNGVKQVLMF